MKDLIHVMYLFSKLNPSGSKHLMNRTGISNIKIAKDFKDILKREQINLFNYILINFIKLDIYKSNNFKVLPNFKKSHITSISKKEDKKILYELIKILLDQKQVDKLQLESGLRKLGLSAREASHILSDISKGMKKKGDINLDIFKTEENNTQAIINNKFMVEGTKGNNIGMADEFSEFLIKNNLLKYPNLKEKDKIYKILDILLKLILYEGHKYRRQLASELRQSGLSERGVSHILSNISKYMKTDINRIIGANIKGKKDAIIDEESIKGINKDELLVKWHSNFLEDLNSKDSSIKEFFKKDNKILNELIKILLDQKQVDKLQLESGLRKLGLSAREASHILSDISKGMKKKGGLNLDIYRAEKENTQDIINNRFKGVVEKVDNHIIRLKDNTSDKGEIKGNSIKVAQDNKTISKNGDMFKRKIDEKVGFEKRLKLDVAQSYNIDKNILNTPTKVNFINRNYIFNQIESGIYYIIKNGKNFLRLRLFPPDLGTIKIEMKIKDQRCKIYFFPENSSIRDIIITHREDIKNLFLNHGIRLDNINVFISKDLLNQGLEGKKEHKDEELYKRGKNQRFEFEEEIETIQPERYYRMQNSNLSVMV